jgi:hypothetical protein
MGTVGLLLVVCYDRIARLSVNVQDQVSISHLHIAVRREL